MFRFSPHHSACPYCQRPMDQAPSMHSHCNHSMEAGLCLRDYGPYPFVMNIEEATMQNEYFRTTLWTGSHLQLTLMTVPPGESIGLERHPNIDQFLRLEQGQGVVEMGLSKEHLTFKCPVEENDVIIVPAGYWHNIINTGMEPIKLYSIYAPPKHPFGTIHRTKADAMEGEES